MSSHILVILSEDYHLSNRAITLHPVGFNSPKRVAMDIVSSMIGLQKQFKAMVV